MYLFRGNIKNMIHSVLAFGNFDIISNQDKHFLKEARKYGDILIVIICADKKLIELGLNKPTNNEQIRKKNLINLGIADIVEIGDNNKYFQTINKYKPSIIALQENQSKLIYELGEFLYESKIKTNVVTIN